MYLSSTVTFHRPGTQCVPAILLVLLLMLVLSIQPQRALADDISITEYSLPSGYSGQPDAITSGPDGSLWFTDYYGIGRVSRHGTFTYYTIPTPYADAQGITAGPDGNIWFTESSYPGKIGRITPAGSFSEFPLPVIISGTQELHTYPYDIVSGPDGNLWFTESHMGTNSLGPRIGRITPGGTITEFNVPTTDEADLRAITSGPDGALWFTDMENDQIGRMTTGGDLTLYSIPKPVGDMSMRQPFDITTGPDSNLWIVERSHNSLLRLNRTTHEFTRYFLSQTIKPQAIVTGPDGAFWVTSSTALGRFTLDGHYSEYPLPIPGSSYGITRGMDGAVWFTEYERHKLGRANLPNAISEFTLLASAGNPSGAVVGPDGRIYVTHPGASAVTSSAGTGSNRGEDTQTTQLPDGSQPENGTGWPANDCANRIGTGCGPSIVAALPPDAAFWFTEYGTNKIGRIPINSINYTEYSLATPNACPYDMAIGPDKAVWFTEYCGNAIGRVTPTGTVKIDEFSLPSPKAPLTTSGPSGIVAGRDGALWFTESLADKIGRMTIGGQLIAEYPLPAGSHPQDITAGMDGNLWFTEPGSNRIGRMTTTGQLTEYLLPTPNSNPYSIVQGPDLALWFTEAGSNKIGRITLQGAIEEYRVPTMNSEPLGIAVGIDGNLWFVERAGNLLGTLAPRALESRLIPVAIRNHNGGW